MKTEIVAKSFVSLVKSAYQDVNIFDVPRLRILYQRRCLSSARFALHPEEGFGAQFTIFLDKDDLQSAVFYHFTIFSRFRLNV